MAKKGLHVDKIQYVFTESTAPLFDTWASRPLGAETSLREVLDETVDVYILEGTGIRFSGRNVGEAIHGTSGADTLYGSGGKDAIFGSLGDDYIKGGRGGDLIFGDDGDDQIYGGPGADFLVGGAGSNTLFGGDGGDTAVYLGSLSDYNVSEVDGTTYVTSLADSTQQDALQNIEYLQFGYDVYRIEDALAGVSQENSGSTQTGSIQPVPEPDPTPDPAPEPDPLSADIILNSAFPVSYADAEAGASVLLDIGVILDGGTGSEDVRVVVSGLPDGVSLSAGENIGAGEWSLTFEELDGLTMNLPPMISDFAVAVTAALVTVGGLTTLASAETLMDTNADLLAMGSTTPTEPTDTSDTSDPVDTSGGDVVTGGTATSDPIAVPEPTPAANLGAGEIVQIGLQNNTSTTAPADYKTFGHVFAQGDLPAGESLVAVINGFEYQVQVNVKATWDDGSAKHAILTMATPELAAGQSVDAVFMLADSGPGGADLTTQSVFTQDLDLQIVLDFGAGDISIDALDELQQAISENRVETWIDGPFASEYSFTADIPGNDHLKVHFDVRVYANGEVRTDVSVASESTYLGGVETYQYSAEIYEGGELVFQDTDIAHHRNANWHTQVWSNGEPAAFVSFDVDYMASTGAIPHYDTSLGVREADIQRFYDAGLADSDPMGAAGIMTSMPTTGGRADLGVLPTWTAQFLVSQDQMAFDSMMFRADAAGSIPWHFVDEATGTYVSLIDRPQLKIDQRYESGPDALADPYLDIQSVTGWKPDLAHQPSLSYVPYLVTGDRYHLQNQLAQNSYNIASIVDTDRNQADGFLVLDQEVYQQTRGSAWTLRTLLDTSFIIPDGHPLEAYFDDIVNFNLDFMYEKYVVNGFFDWAGEIEGFFDSNGIRAGTGKISPWMQDFLVSALGVAAERGYSQAVELLDWSTNFFAGRFINEDLGYLPEYGAEYKLYLADEAGDPVTTWAGLFEGRYGKDSVLAEGEYLGSPKSGAGYVAYAKMSLASIINATGSADAIEAYGFLVNAGYQEGAYSLSQSKGYASDPTFFLTPFFADGTALTVDRMSIDGSFDGHSGNELLYGSTGNDTLNGNGGIDWIFGDDGNDAINGGDGDDYLFGGDGDDTINGGAGSDIMKGNGGADTFVFDMSSSGFDVISDFNVNEDTLLLNSTLLASTAGSVASLINTAYEQDGGVVLTLGGLEIFLEDLTLANLSSVDFQIGG